MQGREGDSQHYSVCYRSDNMSNYLDISSGFAHNDLLFKAKFIEAKDSYFENLQKNQ